MKTKIKNGIRSKFRSFPVQLFFRLTPFISIGIIFLVLWSELVKGHLDKIDKYILLAFRSARNSDILIGPDWLPRVVRSVTFLGDSIFLILMVFAVSGLLIAKRAYVNALLLPVLSMSGFWIISLLKDFFGRPRPLIVEYLSVPNSASFPSGHAANSTIVYILMAVALFEIVPGKYARICLTSVAFILALLIGISRIALGVHWPSDVLGGWIFGLGWCCLWFLKDSIPDSPTAFSRYSSKRAR
jgi:undecaprenyl-diphosphatase